MDEAWKWYLLTEFLLLKCTNNFQHTDFHLAQIVSVSPVNNVCGYGIKSKPVTR
jgi:hypothetical protein